MKYFVKFFVITFCLIIYTHAYAEQRVVTLDMKLLLNTSKAGKGAQDFLQKTFKDNVDKFTKQENKLKEEEKDLLTKKNILTKEEYKKKSDELRNKVTKYQVDRRGALDKITTMRAEARQKLVDKINPILKNYITENNVSLVIDKKYVLGGGANLDITNIIIEKLNKEIPSLNLK